MSLSPFAERVLALLRRTPLVNCAPDGNGYVETPVHELADEEAILKELSCLLADRSVFLRQRDSRIDATELYYNGVLRRSKHQGAAEGQDITKQLIEKFNALETQAREGPCEACRSVASKISHARLLFKQASEIVAELPSEDAARAAWDDRTWEQD